MTVSRIMIYPKHEREIYILTDRLCSLTAQHSRVLLEGEQELQRFRRESNAVYKELQGLLRLANQTSPKLTPRIAVMTQDGYIVPRPFNPNVGSFFYLSRRTASGVIEVRSRSGHEPIHASRLRFKYDPAQSRYCQYNEATQTCNPLRWVEGVPPEYRATLDNPIAPLYDPFSDDDDMELPLL